MTEKEIPSGHGVRERLLVEVETVRQRYLAAKQAGKTLRWFDVEHWIDRERWLVMPVGLAKQLSIENLATAPESKHDDIEFLGCRKTISTVWQMIRTLGVFIGGAGLPAATAPTDFLNLAVIQPLLNPAFDSLFWLALAWQMGPNRTERNLGEAIGGMTFDLSIYPASLAEAPQVRSAQVEWVKSVFTSGLDVRAWARASDADWASHCKELMHERRDYVENVFFEIAHKARRMRADPDD